MHRPLRRRTSPTPYRTPWGDALNVAEAGSDHVRRTFIESACRWIEDFHVDGLRVDAVHAIHDPTARPFLEELTAAVHDAGAARRAHRARHRRELRQRPAVVRPPASGGIGFDAVWNDDVHHALRVALTGDRRGYYADYDGVADLATALAHRWLFAGRYSAYRGRRHGRSRRRRRRPSASSCSRATTTTSATRRPAPARRTTAPQRLVAAATVLLSPFTPMLFMGEEYAEPAPFPFFVDHGDPELLEATRGGPPRASSATSGPRRSPTRATRRRSPAPCSTRRWPTTEPHRKVLAAYTELLALRRAHGVLRAATPSRTSPATATPSSSTPARSTARAVAARARLRRRVDVDSRRRRRLDGRLRLRRSRVGRRRRRRCSTTARSHRRHHRRPRPPTPSGRVPTEIARWPARWALSRRTRTIAGKAARAASTSSVPSTSGSSSSEHVAPAARRQLDGQRRTAARRPRGTTVTSTGVAGGVGAGERDERRSSAASGT